MARNKAPIIIPKEKAVFRMDANGIWHNEHGRLEHPRIIQYFNRSIHKDDQGYFLSQTMEDGREERVYFPCEETAFFVVDLAAGPPVRLLLNTGRTLDLDPKGLYISNDSLFMRTDDLLVKFNHRALTKMARFLEDTDRGMVLNLGGTRYPVPEK